MRRGVDSEVERGGIDSDSEVGTIEVGGCCQFLPTPEVHFSFSLSAIASICLPGA
jgi:hypothetical protein